MPRGAEKNGQTHLATSGVAGYREVCGGKVVRFTASAGKTRSMTRARDVRRRLISAAGLAACLLTVATAWEIFPTGDGDCGACVSAMKRGSTSNAVLPIGQAVAEAEVSLDDADPGHGPSYPSAASGDIHRYASRCGSRGSSRVGFEPSALAANAVNLSRLCRLLI